MLTGVGVAGWQFDWWLQGKNVDKKVQIENRNNGTQLALLAEVRRSITDITLVEDGAQRRALVNQACPLIERLTGPTLKGAAEVVAWADTNCP